MKCVLGKKKKEREIEPEVLRLGEKKFRMD